MTKNRFNNNISILKEAIENDRLVVFAGAGVSKDSGVPLWKELEEGINRHLDESTNEQDPLKIAQMLYNEKGEKEYNDIITNILFKNQQKYNPIHEILFDLNPQHIITTNYDSYFENVINDEGLAFSNISKDIDLPYAKHKKLLIKYHGDFDNNNIVLKESDYLEFSKKHTLKEVFVKSLFSNKIILFVGYSVSDPNLKLLIKDIQFILKKHHQRAYLLTAKTNVSNSEIKYFENLGINILSYNEGNLKVSNKEINLSDTGKKTYSLLKHLRDFELYSYRNFVEGISNKTKITNEIYNSFQRFEYLRVLPQKTIADLYPLNKNAKQDTAYRIDGTILKCFNQELYNLIEDYQGISDENFSKEDKEKLDYCLKKIVYSGIYYLGKADKAGAYCEYRVKEKIDLTSKINHNKNCDCIDCSLDKYKISSSLKRISKYVIDEKSVLWDDLTYAYSLYRVSDYFNSYQAYKRIIVKANRLHHYEVSFISKFNIKRLVWLVSNDFYNKKIEKEDLSKVREEIEKINLDEELDKVKCFVDRDVYNMLREIKDGVYLQRLCNEIDEIFVKVPKTVENIKKGGSESSNVFQNLYRTVNRLRNFLDGNFILGNGYSPIKVTLQKSIKTFVLGYYLKRHTPNDESQHIFGVPYIDNFDTSFFRLIIENSNPKELSDFLEKNKVQNIEFENESQNEVVLLINNFFTSSYTINRRFGNSLNEDHFFTSYLNHNTGYKSRLKFLFNNICVVLAYFDFSENSLKSIYKNLNYFIEFVGFSDREFTCFDVFLHKKRDLLNVDNGLMETLRILNKQKNFNDSYFTVLEILSDKKKLFVNNEFKLELFNFETFWHQFPLLYKTSPKELKKPFRQKLSKTLDANKDPQSYYFALNRKVLSSRKTKNNYKQIIGNKLKFDTSKNGSYSSTHLHYIIQFFDLANKGKIDTSGFEDLDIKDQQYIFLLNPEKYDKSKFNVKWIKDLNWSSFCEKFSKIDYIIESIEKELKNEYDEELSKIYFRIKKFKKNQST